MDQHVHLSGAPDDDPSVLASSDVEVPVDAPLDELLHDVDDVGPARAPQSGWFWIGRVGLLTGAASALVYTLARAVGLAPPLLLILAISGGAVIVQEVAGLVREPRWRRTRDVLRPPAGRSAPAPRSDGMLAAVRRWDHRLASVGATRAGRPAADRGLRAALGELADERLRQRYGLTRASDPTRARQVLGEPVWQVLQRGAASRPPTPAEVEVAVRRLESL
jgi:hypothetical protein